MSAFVDETADGSATRLCDTTSGRVVVGAAAWSGLLRRALGTVLRGAYEPLLRRRDAGHVIARGGEMPSGREDMDLCTDKVLSKGRILQELTKAVKLVSDPIAVRRTLGPPTAAFPRVYTYTRSLSAACDARAPRRKLCNDSSLRAFPS